MVVCRTVAHPSLQLPVQHPALNLQALVLQAKIVNGSDLANIHVLCVEENSNIQKKLQYFLGYCKYFFT